ncbi:cation transporter [Asanoa sp. NPDC050611]|uniref:cation transporter n=1 Tax=Asanoa sp. NPDC050611 TaxID=3157098 RepID=UPI0034084878
MCDNCACQAAKPATAATASGREFAVAGMTCSSCAAKVDAAVRGVAGVADVDVDVAAGRITITGDVNEAAIAAAVVGAGYRISEA